MFKTIICAFATISAFPQTQTGHLKSNLTTWGSGNKTNSSQPKSNQTASASNSTSNRLHKRMVTQDQPQQAGYRQIQQGEGYEVPPGSIIFVHCGPLQVGRENSTNTTTTEGQQRQGQSQQGMSGQRPQGTQGQQGTLGQQGTQGLQGTQGTQGQQGQQGNL